MSSPYLAFRRDVNLKWLDIRQEEPPGGLTHRVASRPAGQRGHEPRRAIPGHLGFTAVGIPASLPSFAALHSYDNVREPRLPAELRDKNPNGTMWRRIDGPWTQGDVTKSG